MRNNYFDVLKAIAIIAVVLYHMGICEYGYLGVDMFLVIAGYFTSKSIDSQIVNRGYWRFITNRLFRLWPLLLIAGATCLCFGWFMMLPDDYENAAQSIIATNFFGNNILQAFTIRNYWQVSNQYMPLMHTWYVGLIMQFYVIVPLILFAVGSWIKGCGARTKVNIALLALIGIISLLGFLTEGNTTYKFYFLPYRLYEFCAGGLVFYLFGKGTNLINNKIWLNISFTIVFLVVLALLFVDDTYISRPARLLSIVALSAVLLAMMPRVGWAQKRVFANKWVATIGAASFSIFVWHQVILAMIRYSFTKEITNTLPFIAFVGLTVILSILSYKYVERMKKTRMAWCLIALLLLLTSAGSLYIYANAGVIRDVPELEIKKGEAHRGMWAEYCDRGYLYGMEFTDSDLPKWYVIGNSFGRDMVNIILESPYADKVEVVYSDMVTYQDCPSRFAVADVVILSTLMVDDDDIANVMAYCSEKSRFILVGEKNFGENNGQIYRHRYDSDYHQLTIEMEDGYAERNARLKEKYKKYFIDMIEMVRQPDGKVRVFTDDGRFISQDCKHLTKAGAQYYATLFDWERFFK